MDKKFVSIHGGLTIPPPKKNKLFYNGVLQHWSVVDEKTQQHNNQQAFYGNEHLQRRVVDKHLPS